MVPFSQVDSGHWNKIYELPKLCFKATLSATEAIDMKILFNSHANKTHFHNKGFVISLVLALKLVNGPLD